MKHKRGNGEEERTERKIGPYKRRELRELPLLGSKITRFFFSLTFFLIFSATEMGAKADCNLSLKKKGEEGSRREREKEMKSKTRNEGGR